MGKLEMSEAKPLQRPPGYREPGLPPQKPPQLEKLNLPPSFFPETKRRNWCCRCCCCFVIFSVLLTLFFISFGGFLYLWYEPRAPVFGLKSLKVQKFNVTKARNGATLDSQIDISIEFKNTNKNNIKFVYDRTTMLLHGNSLSGDLNLGQRTVPGFSQGRNNVTVVKFTMKGKEALNGQDAKRVTEQFRAKSLMMTVELSMEIGIEVNGLSTGTVSVNIVCGASTLKDIQNGAIPKCRVLIFRTYVLILPTFICI